MRTTKFIFDRRFLVAVLTLALVLVVLYVKPHISSSIESAGREKKPSPRVAAASTEQAILTPSTTPPDHVSLSAPREFDYIWAKAAELGFDRERIIQFVQRDIAPEPYQGALRGPLGTLWSAAGNSVDRADLLAALLRSSGERVRFARDGDRFWVQVADSDEWHDTVLADETEAAPVWTGTEIPEDLRHSLAIEVEVQANQQRQAVSAAFPTRTLAGDPLVLQFRGEKFYLQRLSASKSQRSSAGIQGRCGLADDETLSLIFRHRGPGVTGETIYRREIYTGHHARYEKQNDTRNTHVIAALPGTISNWAFRQERTLANQRNTPKHLAQGYLLTLSHMVESDAALKKMTAHFEASAYFTEPRVIIASAYYRGNQTAPIAHALDLRRNTIHVAGDDKTRANFAVTRSVFEGSLEAKVLRDATGAPVVASLEVFRQHLAPFKWSTPGRIESYKDILNRFSRETEPGARLTISIDKKQRVAFTHLDEGGIQFQAIDTALAEKMKDSGLPWPNLGGQRINQSKLSATSVELETLLGPLAETEVDYQPIIEISDSLAQLIRPGVRVVNRSLPALMTNPFTRFDYEIKSATPEGGLIYESIDEWDEQNNRMPLQVQRFHIPPKTVESTDLLSTWCSQRRYDRGVQHLMFSRKMYRELKEQGFTQIRFLKYNETESQPLKLYLVQRATVKIGVNGKVREVPLLWVAGDYAEKNSPRRSWFWTRQIKDKSGPRQVVMNMWVIVDNARFPLVVSPATRFQTTIPGRVVSATSGRGLGEAEITIRDLNESGGAALSEGVSWADGQFRLPVIKKAYGKFAVEVRCRGFETFRTEINFAKESAVPLRIKLQPAPRPESMLWVGKDNATTELARIENPRVRGLVRQAIEDNPNLSALVPRQRTNFGLDSAHAWLLFDNKTFHITPVTEDGLHGVAGELAVHTFGEDPQGSAVSAYAGTMSSWYSYSAGKLDWLAKMMSGQTSAEDLGHDHAIKFALEFLESMRPEGFLAEAAAAGAGVNQDAFEAGFLAGLSFFEKYPGFKGE